jgi:Protein of unknown function (DUF3040)
VLSSQERRIWQDVERRYTVETDEPTLPDVRPAHDRRPAGRSMDDLPAAIVVGIWISIALVLVGFVVAGLAVGAVTTTTALLWRWWPPRG